MKGGEDQIEEVQRDRGYRGGPDGERMQTHRGGTEEMRAGEDILYVEYL